MCITLSEKLASIQNDQTVAQLKLMLPHAEIFISSWGQRMVRIAGYKEAVTIDTLANKYLQADPFQNHSLATLKDINDCRPLWGKFQTLYKKSDKELEKTCIYKFLIPALEYRYHPVSYLCVKMNNVKRIINLDTMEIFKIFHLLN